MTGSSGSNPHLPASDLADPTIDRVLGEFLAEQRERLSDSTARKYEAVISYLRHHLDGYGYEALTPDERCLFERYYEAEGQEHREFCQIFGPEKIVDNLGTFLGYFMVRKVLGGAETGRAAGTVTKKLCSWLAGKGHIAPERADEGVRVGAAAARELPRAQRAAEILYREADRLDIDPNTLADEDYLEFDHYSIAKLEPGRIWLQIGYEAGAPELVSVTVRRDVASLLAEGWELSCALGRDRGRWRIVQMGNVYP